MSHSVEVRYLSLAFGFCSSLNFLNPLSFFPFLISWSSFISIYISYIYIGFLNEKLLFQIVDILTKMKKSVDIPVTCKIRLLPNMEQTLGMITEE